MRARVLPFLFAGAALAACHPAPSHRHEHFGGVVFPPVFSADDDREMTVTRPLDCPDHEGDLTRVAQASDGASCSYTGDDGRRVDLKILALNGSSPQAALQPIEGEVNDLVPLKGGAIANIDASSGGKNNGDTKIDLPGIHINASGDKADVDVFGAHIKADGDRADVTTDLPLKGTQIHAGPGGAEIRAGETGKHAANLLYLRAADAAGPEGWRTAGFEARGPVAGPLLVAEFRSKGDDRDRARVQLKRLLDLNIKVGDDAG